MRKSTFLIVVSLFTFTGWGQSASAGERLDYDVKQSNTQEVVTIYVQGPQARVLSSADQTAALIFDADSRQIHILNHTDKTITTIDQASLQQLASIAEGVGEIAKSQGGVLGDIFKTFGFDNDLGSSAQIDVKTLSEKKSYSGKSCQMQQVFVNGQLNTQICLTQQLHMDGSERATLDSLLGFAQLLIRQGQMILEQFNLPIPLLPESALQGTPVYVDDLASKTTATLVGFRQMDVAAQQFALPPAYSRRVLSL